MCVRPTNFNLLEYISGPTRSVLPIVKEEQKIERPNTSRWYRRLIKIWLRMLIKYYKVYAENILPYLLKIEELQKMERPNTSRWYRKLNHWSCKNTDKRGRFTAVCAINARLASIKMFAYLKSFGFPGEGRWQPSSSSVEIQLNVSPCGTEPNKGFSSWWLSESSESWGALSVDCACVVSLEYDDGVEFTEDISERLRRTDLCRVPNRTDKFLALRSPP